MKLLNLFKPFRDYKTKQINKALGIELLPWQIEYIFNADADPSLLKKSESYTNKITAVALRQILDKNTKYIWTLRAPLTYQELQKRHLLDYISIYEGRSKPTLRGRNFLLQWRRLYKKLKTTNLRLAEVAWVR